MPKDVLSEIDLYPAPGNMVFFFLINTSAGMLNGDRMERANKILCDSAATLRELQKSDECKIYRICVMGFGQGAAWLQCPVPIADYDDIPIQANSECCFFGAALKELNAKLSRNAFFNHLRKVYIPVIVLLTDGHISADEDCLSAMEEIGRNGWYKASMRYAVLLEDESEFGSGAEEVINRFVTGEEGIVSESVFVKSLYSFLASGMKRRDPYPKEDRITEAKEPDFSLMQSEDPSFDDIFRNMFPDSFE